MVAAARYYVGTDGDFDTTASWSATLGGASGATVPVSDDDAYILDLDHAFATNVSQAAVNLGSLTITLKQGGSVGTASDPFVIGVANTGQASRAGQFRMSSAGGGQVYFNSGTDGVTELHARNVQAVLGSGSGDFTTCYLYNCNTTFASSAGPGTLLTFGGTTNVLNGATAITAITQQVGGSMVVDRVVTGGWNVIAGSCTGGENSDPATVKIYDGGKFNYLGSATITDMACYGPGSIATDTGNRFGFTCSSAGNYGGGSAFDDPQSDITITTRVHSPTIP